MNFLVRLQSKTITVAGIIFSMNLVTTVTHAQTNSCIPGALSSGVANMVNKTANTLQYHLDPEDPKDIDSCAFKNQDTPLLEPHEDLGLITKILSNQPIILNKGRMKSCLNEPDGTQIGMMEYISRNTLCRDNREDLDSKYLKDHGVTDTVEAIQNVKNIVAKQAKAVTADNGLFLQNSEQMKLTLGNIEKNAQDFLMVNPACHSGVRVVVGSDPGVRFQIYPGQTEVQTRAFAQQQVEQWRTNGKRFCSNPNGPIEKAVAVSSAQVFTGPTVFSLRQQSKGGAWDLNSSDTQALIQQIQDSPIVKSNLACGRTPQFKIFASASKLENKGPSVGALDSTDTNGVFHAGRWNQIMLAQKRADFARDEVLKKLNLPGYTPEKMSDQDFKSSVHYQLGEDGKGASGPCPYSLEKHGNKYRVVKINKIFSDPAALQKIRHDNQTVQIQVSFTGPETCGKFSDIPGHPHLQSVAVSCFDVHYQCK